ncbi:MAG: acyl-CoA desaturase [Lentisphaeraceae bacterium]|nr:acyl-CoA desaturase [Lentisphaeraceae bacterium]
MKRLIKDGDPLRGTVKLSIEKIIMNGGCLILGLAGIIYYKDSTAVLAALFVTLFTMYVGVVAYHRLLIHRSFTCPKWLEYLLIFIGNFSAIGSPLGQVKIHEFRDWAQRKEKCHRFFAHKENIFKDGFQQLFCEIHLENPPKFYIKEGEEVFYKHMERYWFLYQVPLALVLFYFGGISWIAAAVFMKIFTIHFGHWLIAFLIHNYGKQPVKVPGAGVQGFNIPLLALLTFGEAYHNNHHLCPNAAKNAFEKDQLDPAWWLILCLAKLGLASNIIIYETGIKRIL